ncbi:AraC family transcriptional regulator [Shimia sp. FJ5]|uniref:AraC family transcriptional regulator n=1 Tax=Shimia sp. FJ5 TaxID=3079054 RepID=UPI002639E878|nr:AraC family transcriptional regulator [Shimia sp. FJ5]MDV4145864.1 AraC family transcriptional regulator [Shimia sp. FJ5]
MSLEELEALAARYVSKNAGQRQALLPNLHVFQRDETSAFEASIYDPVICLILRGSKETHIGAQSVVLQRGDALLVSHDLPVMSRITQTPYCALILSIDIGIVRSFYVQVGEVAHETQAARSLSASVAQGALLEALGRYLRLMEDPLEAQVLGPLILRELHYRLLISPIGGMLRNLLAVDSHASRVAKAITRIRRDFREPLVVADLAQVAGMSQSSFHEHFKAVTGTTPLQYQKDLRLIEAQSLLREGQRSVATTSFEVGYESPTHFSRDYSRKFGCSPKHHLAQVSLSPGGLI